MGGRCHGQTQNQAELPSPSASASRFGSLQSGVLNSLGSHAASTNMPLTNLLPGTAPSLGSLSTVSSSFATACTWNPEGWPPTPSTSNSLPCAVSQTKLPTPACSVPSWRRASAESRELNHSAFASMANQIHKSADLWDLERYLTQRHKDINNKYDFRSSRLTRTFRRLLYEGRVSED